MLKVLRARRNVIKSEIIMKVLISTKLVIKASFKIFLTLFLTLDYKHASKTASVLLFKILTEKIN